MNNLELNAAEGWQEVKPRANVPSLLAEVDGRLQLLGSDLETLFDFGAVGPVDCPIAYDPVRRLAFRYVCAAGFQRSDFSQLRVFSIERKESYPLIELPLNQWVLWFLEWDGSATAGSGQLFGLSAVDRPVDEQIVIEHRLFSVKPGEAQLRLRPLCRDAYKPLAFSSQRGELVFAGAEGIYLLGSKGERKRSQPNDSLATGQGAAFDPSGAPKVVVGGDGLHLWDTETNCNTRLTRNGRYPVWAHDGKGIWYRESSADIHYYDFAADESRCVLRLGNGRLPDYWNGRPVCLSTCGRYLAASLSEKVLRGVSAKGSATGARERVYVHTQSLCILDLERREYWQRSGFANHLRWT